MPKIVTQNLRTGLTELADTACPNHGPGEVLIKSSKSLVSAGTERMLIDFGRANYIQKARQQPEKVRMALDKIKTDGLLTTLDAINSKLDMPIALGYCNVGTIISVGTKVKGMRVGDRVVSNGYHSEIVCVPENLVCKVPDNVTDSDAVYTVISSIALQGIRLSKPTLGECYVVTGLGLVGLLTVKLLKAQGCRVLGLDYSKERLMLAKSFGAEVHDLNLNTPHVAADKFSRGKGIDAVIITAATNSSDPIAHAAQMCRKLGRVVLVGVSGLDLNRDDFFKKEIKFQVSASYGPGRYDANYENKGHDYPIGYVRWTERRNFEAILDMMSEGALDTAQLTTHTFKFNDAAQAYDTLLNSKDSLGILLEYNSQAASISRTIKTSHVENQSVLLSDKPKIAMFGAGNYSTSMLLPVLKKTNATLKTIVSEKGLSGWHAARKFGFEKASTSSSETFIDPSIDVAIIATRHDKHYELVKAALEHGKHVFVEKPLCLTSQELSDLKKIYYEMPEKPQLMVGFNRRFSPFIVKLNEEVRKINQPISVNINVNAGKIPLDHWAHDHSVGGGRILGEACHFVDLMRFLAGSKIKNSKIVYLDNSTLDTASILLSFENGSIGTLNYYANGNKKVPKERIEVFCDGKIAQIDNFLKLKSHGWKNLSNERVYRQDKGQKLCISKFIDNLSSSESLIDVSELFEIQEVMLSLTKKTDVASQF